MGRHFFPGDPYISRTTVLDNTPLTLSQRCHCRPLTIVILLTQMILCSCAILDCLQAGGPACLHTRGVLHCSGPTWGFARAIPSRTWASLGPKPTPERSIQAHTQRAHRNSNMHSPGGVSTMIFVRQGA